jgi:acyl-CoA synthetase (AMP-forming)/AMP-acid ligase II
VPDEEWGESVRAAVELAPGFAPSPALAAEILAFGRERLAGFKLPRELVFEAELPRHPTGKLLVRELRERHARAGAQGRGRA